LLAGRRSIMLAGPTVTAPYCSDCARSTRRDDIIAIGAVHIRGNRIVTNERFEAVVRSSLTNFIAKFRWSTPYAM
jgi:hypothetical protein